MTKARACRGFEPDGRPSSQKCHRTKESCYYAHPEDPEWPQARRDMPTYPREPPTGPRNDNTSQPRPTLSRRDSRRSPSPDPRSSRRSRSPRRRPSDGTSSSYESSQNRRFGPRVPTYRDSSPPPGYNYASDSARSHPQRQYSDEASSSSNLRGRRPSGVRSTSRHSVRDHSPSASSPHRRERQRSRSRSPSRNHVRRLFTSHSSSSLQEGSARQPTGCDEQNWDAMRKASELWSDNPPTNRTMTMEAVGESPLASSTSPTVVPCDNTETNNHTKLTDAAATSPAPVPVATENEQDGSPARSRDSVDTASTRCEAKQEEEDHLMSRPGLGTTSSMLGIIIPSIQAVEPVISSSVDGCAMITAVNDGEADMDIDNSEYGGDDATVNKALANPVALQSMVVDEPRQAEGSRNADDIPPPTAIAPRRPTEQPYLNTSPTLVVRGLPSTDDLPPSLVLAALNTNLPFLFQPSSSTACTTAVPFASPADTLRSLSLSSYGASASSHQGFPFAKQAASGPVDSPHAFQEILRRMLKPFGQATRYRMDWEDSQKKLTQYKKQLKALEGRTTIENDHTCAPLTPGPECPLGRHPSARDPRLARNFSAPVPPRTPRTPRQTDGDEFRQVEHSQERANLIEKIEQLNRRQADITVALRKEMSVLEDPLNQMRLSLEATVRSTTDDAISAAMTTLRSLAPPPQVTDANVTVWPEEEFRALSERVQRIDTFVQDVLHKIPELEASMDEQILKFKEDVLAETAEMSQRFTSQVEAKALIAVDARCTEILESKAQELLNGKLHTYCETSVDRQLLARCTEVVDAKVDVGRMEMNGKLDTLEERVKKIEDRQAELVVASPPTNSKKRKRTEQEDADAAAAKSEPSKRKRTVSNDRLEAMETSLVKMEADVEALSVRADGNEGLLLLGQNEQQTAMNVLTAQMTQRMAQNVTRVQAMISASEQKWSGLMQQEHLQAQRNYQQLHQNYTLLKTDHDQLKTDQLQLAKQYADQVKASERMSQEKESRLESQTDDLHKMVAQLRQQMEWQANEQFVFKKEQMAFNQAQLAFRTDQLTFTEEKQALESQLTSLRQTNLDQQTCLEAYRAQMAEVRTRLDDLGQSVQAVTAHGPFTSAVPSSPSGTSQMSLLGETLAGLFANIENTIEASLQHMS